MNWQPGEIPATAETGAESANPELITAKTEALWAALTDGDVTRADLIRVWTDLGIPIVKALVLIVAVIVIASWLARLTVRVAKKSHIEITLAKFFGNMVRYAILVLGALAVLSTFGVETTSFAAVIAALGFAVGMALSGTLGNAASGILLLVFRPFKVGDVVSAGGVTGKVEELGLFTTTFDTPDNRRIVVPNNSIFGSTIENVTFHDTRRVDVAVGTDYGADLDRTRSILMGAAEAVEGRLAEKEPVVYLDKLGDSSIAWAVRVWAKTPDYWAVRERLTRDVKVALDGADIGIPFPQMVVTMSKPD